MKKILCVLFVFCFCSIALGQTEPSKPGETIQLKITELPPRAPFKPKLAMTKALKLMEKFIAEKKIDTSRHFLSGASLIYFGSDGGKKERVWFFAWDNGRMILGDYIHIMVSMDGRVWQMSTM